jgi:hypothetical protein
LFNNRKEWNARKEKKRKYEMKRKKEWITEQLIKKEADEKKKRRK